MYNTKITYVQDLIGDRYKEWENDKIIFDCGTGHGKTTFIFKILAKWAIENNKRILYLCNRKQLLSQLLTDVEAYAAFNVEVMLYQTLQRNIVKNEEIKHYDYIIADEVHYLLSDAFNDYTDLSYKYLMQQNQSVVVFMSATAKSLFKMFVDNGIVELNNVYTITKDYSYVDKTYFYEKRQLTAIINNILQTSNKDKILVFCNSLKYLNDMREIYKDQAYYMCSETNINNKNNRDHYNNNCIKSISKELITFDKRILFTTKVLDNGVNIIDPDLKHIFTDIFDIDSTIQAIRKKKK
jgi:superfamily II DNA or RNA helicase